MIPKYHSITSRRPYLALLNKERLICDLVDFSISADDRVEIRKRKYLDITREQKCQWNTIITVIIWCLRWNDLQKNSGRQDNRNSNISLTTLKRSRDLMTFVVKTLWKFAITIASKVDLKKSETLDKLLNLFWKR